MQQRKVPDRRDRPGPEGQLGQHFTETAEVLLDRLNHHVSIADRDRLPVQPHCRAADQQEGHTLRGQDRGGQHRYRVFP
jgi:hypothetical protein